jgi:hypothetical protein
MSHATVLVITKDKPNDENIGYEMRPYHEYESTGWNDEFVVDVDRTDVVIEDYKKYGKDYNSIDEYAKEEGYIVKVVDGETKYYTHTNPNSKWDYYDFGGRFSGYLDNITINKCGDDYTKKSNIDFFKHKDEIAKEIADNYDKLVKIVNGREVPCFDEIVATTLDENGKPDYDKARKIYHSNPVIQDIDNSEILHYLGYFENPYEIIKTPREEYINNKVLERCLPFAVVYNRKWYEIGELGWWATVSNEMNIKDWNKKIMEIWNSIPDEYYVSIIDYHI